MTAENISAREDSISVKDKNMDSHGSLTFHFMLQISTEWRQTSVASLEHVLAKAAVDLSNGYDLTFRDIRLEGQRAHFLVNCRSPGYSPRQIAILIQVMTNKAAVSLPAERRVGYWNRGMWEPGFSVETVCADDMVL